MAGTFAGKVALVTGAASGIGRAAAIRFAQEGARVFCADLNLAGAQAVAAEIGSNASAVEVDVASYASNQAMVDAVLAQAGQLDIAFLNAGFYGAAEGLDTVDEAFFDKVVAINLKGTFGGIKAVQPVIAQGGAVVVTASAAGVVGHPANPAYSAAKHGIVGLVKSCVDAFAARGARINAICPGGVETPLIGAADVAMIDPQALPRVPLRGMGSAQHVAEVALWLSSPAAGFITGQAQVLDAALLSTFAPVILPVGP
ncbi:SDR family NAD(P)-dependent oxidoreductase [Novosphingobium taihuense]|uniref:NAD(P)-dependent dehydrogenase (Short-subunit alcohol dehydrogenase family) n=1 Tax=Novosphingobium taihuense TaxID=260085 RepID=A0A7W7ABE9_9SPHN|nr:SDR family NAD(P)-dependent oxidoreductase [Novosphingobium taihuense]MBB4613915.1 NAD(P)-dependent dehydrogenase (short-subunit alcohol dehydrogenase family) [Novosphingobium taihuense]TWH86766.1 NAD(P)-dependent dehydrogenase (short-subunit alcohol dehydrogenase family) [Novosphingobium taihuense]